MASRYCNISAAILIIALFITTAVPIADSKNSGGGQKCGGAAECAAAAGDDGEEFLMMDSQTSAWVLDSLQGPSSQKLIYGSLEPGAQCDARRAGSCIANAVNPNLNVCKNIRNRSCLRNR